MNVLNVHERLLPVALPQASPLIDLLATSEDRLWPREHWPKMELDRPLAPGAIGGHGPVRYHVQEYVAGSLVTFRFTAPRGFEGTHGFELLRAGEKKTVIRHTLRMSAQGIAMLTWPLFFKPLHDALLEDAHDRAEEFCGAFPKAGSWSIRVRCLRRIAGLSGSRQSGTNSSRR